eukprot:c10213_g1_i3.p1 GENE.c10213_g1_i3~~c10213_g1_i3.p1  ORF type:complete len:512 (-),score=105.48 c10213_g1_i3:252-1787(-)
MTKLGLSSSRARLVLFVSAITFCAIYFDRGTASSSSQTIEEEFGMTHFETGLTMSGYLAGFAIATPISSVLLQRYSAFAVCGWGFIVWCGASVGCGLSNGFGTFLLWRSLIGLEEAVVQCVLVPLIDIIAPSHRRSLWIGTLTLMMPVGFALGMIVTAAILTDTKSTETAPHSRSVLLESSVAKDPAITWQMSSWRWVFVFQGIIALPIALHFLLSRSPQVLGHSSTESKTLSLQTIRDLFSNVVYLSHVVMIGFLNFDLGVESFFGVQYVENVLGLSKASAGAMMGAVVLIGGIAGAIGGGMILDYEVARAGLATLSTNSDDDGRREDIIAREDSKRVGIVVQTMIPFAIVVPVLALVMFLLRSAEVILVIVTIKTTLSVVITVLLTNGTLWSIPTLALRPFGFGVGAVFGHLIGDFLSLPIAGVIIDQLGYRECMFICNIPLATVPLICLLLRSHLNQRFHYDSQQPHEYEPFLTPESSLSSSRLSDHESAKNNHQQHNPSSRHSRAVN